MIQIILSGLFIFCSIIWYKFYLTPKREMQRYKAILEDLGYKVYVQKVSFLGVGAVDLLKKCQKQHNDAFYPDKNIYANYDVCLTNAANKVMIIFVNPELIKEVLSVDGINKYTKSKFLIAGLKFALGDGIVFSQGDAWKNKRKVISKAFSFELLKQNISKISQISQRWLNEYDQKNTFQQGKIKYDILHMSSKIFCSVITKCFFGCERVDQQVRGECFEDFILGFAKSAVLFSASPLELFLGQIAFKYRITKRIRDVSDKSLIFRQIARQMSEKRKIQVESIQKSDKITDMVQALVYQRIQNNPQAYQYSDEELIDQFATFLLAGTDTTSHYFTMMMYYVARYPKIQEKLRKQVSEFIKSEEDIVHQNLKKLTYIDWIQLQTTRHYGPSNGVLLRVAKQDHYLKDIPIRKGTCAALNTVANHYNPKYFKDPFVFRPERWQNECANLPPYVLTGFSGGPRSCIGKHLALLETKIVLVKFLLRYSNFSLLKKDLKMTFQFIYEPEPFQIVFQTRNTE